MSTDRKKEILDAAVQCFLKYGFDKTTLDDIGEMVGMNKASLYHYFENKMSLFVEALFRESEVFTEKLKRKVEVIRGCKPKVLALVEEGFKHENGAALINQISIETLKGLAPRLNELRNKALENGAVFLASILREGQQEGEIAPCDPLRIAQTIQNVIYSMSDTMYLRARTKPGSADDAAAAIKEIIFAVSLVMDGLAERP